MGRTKTHNKQLDHATETPAQQRDATEELTHNNQGNEPTQKRREEKEEEPETEQTSDADATPGEPRNDNETNDGSTRQQRRQNRTKTRHCTLQSEITTSIGER
eukprot:10748362-Prorocentrum_lima.AAC.1